MTRVHHLQLPFTAPCANVPTPGAPICCGVGMENLFSMHDTRLLDGLRQFSSHVRCGHFFGDFTWPNSQNHLENLGLQQIYGGFMSHRGTPSSHPFLDGDVPQQKPSSVFGVPHFSMETPANSDTKKTRVQLLGPTSWEKAVQSRWSMPMSPKVDLYISKQKKNKGWAGWISSITE